MTERVCVHASVSSLREYAMQRLRVPVQATLDHVRFRGDRAYTRRCWAFQACQSTMNDHESDGPGAPEAQRHSRSVVVCKNATNMKLLRPLVHLRALLRHNEALNAKSLPGR